MIVCREFIEALERCHSTWWGARFTGACNRSKQELNLCLRKEVRRYSVSSSPVLMCLRHLQRVGRAARNREASRERRAKIEEGWQKLGEDD